MKKAVRFSILLTSLFLVSGFTECYKPVTKSQLPAHIKTVAVPAFQNNALRFKIEHRFTQAVMNELAALGIDTNRMSTASFGENKPLVDQDSGWARALNRRVEFQVRAAK